MLAYLREYAAHFELFSHIRFRHEVLNVQRDEKFEHNGRWIVTYRKMAEEGEEAGEVQEESFGQWNLIKK